MNATAWALKESAGRLTPARADSFQGDLYDILLRGEPELNAAVFEHDH
jgi:hypothetical protein